MHEKRLYRNDPNSRISDAEARNHAHYDFIYENPNFLRFERQYLPGNILYTVIQNTEIRLGEKRIYIQTIFDGNEEKIGSTKITEVPNKTQITEFFNAEGELTNKVEGLFTFLVKNGEHQ